MKNLRESNQQIFCKSRLFFVCLLIILVSPIFSISAGVLVAPTSVVLSDKDRTGRMTVQNPTDKPKEISIHFGFGLPKTDSLGMISVRLEDTLKVNHPRSALGWIRAFPRKIVLEPGATQVVRFVANPPKGIPDGEYWARIIIRSQESQDDIPDPADTNQIMTRLNMIMQMAITLKYRTGDLVAKLDIIESEIQDVDTAIAVTLSMANRGNVSYVGTLNIEVTDADKKDVAKRQINLAVYDDLRRRIILHKKTGDFRKPFEAAISIKTEGRNDIPAEDLVPGNIIEFSKAVN